MSDANRIERRKHTQRIKLGIIVTCTPWMFLGFVGLISAGITAAKAARVPLEEIRPLAIVTLSACTLASVVGLAILILGVGGLVMSDKTKGDRA